MLRQSPVVCHGHTRPIVDLSYNSDASSGIFFVSSSKDGRAMLRDGETGDWIGTFDKHNGAVMCCKLDSKALKAATGAGDFTAKVWNVDTGSELVNINEKHIVRSVDLSQTDEGRRILTANNKKLVSVFDLTQPAESLISIEAHGGVIRRVLWCNNDKYALSISEDQTMKLWDLSSAKESTSARQVWCANLNNTISDLHIYAGHGCENSDPSFASEDITKLAMAHGSSVSMFDVDWRMISADSTAPSLNRVFQLPCEVNSVSMHPKAEFFVAGGANGLIYRVDVASGDVIEQCRGHFGPVHCVRFSPDGRIFTSGSEDGTIRLWQTKVGDEFGLWRYVCGTEPNDPVSAPVVAMANA